MPIGIAGTPLHILTNKKIENKSKCTGEVLKQNAKDAFKYVGTLGAVGGAAAAATKFSPKVSNNAKAAINFVKDIISPDLKEMLKLSPLVNKINRLPLPAKVAGAAAVAASLILAPIFMIHAAANAGKVEGNHEVK